MIDHFSELENIATNFDKMNDKFIFCKDQLVKFKEEDKVTINFKECHVAICPNGGLIAICKKKGFLDITRGTKINDHIIIMHQNAKKKYLIPIDWDYREKWVILLDFNEKEQLYAICNDASIFKIDILKQKVIPKPTNESLKTEGIIKAKLFENGFVCLTKDGNFQLINDIKDAKPVLLFPMKSLLNFSNNVDFLPIPSKNSKSGKIELLITNEKNIGVIHIVFSNEKNIEIKANEVTGEIEYEGVSTIINDKLEPFKQKNLEQEIDENITGQQCKNLGKILALAISPSKTQIAMYDNREQIFLFHSTLDLNLEKYPRFQLKFQVDPNLEPEEVVEQQAVLNYEDGFQFLFCGEEAVALSGKRFIFIINIVNKTLQYKITEKGKIDATLEGALFCKCISEIDGLRYITNEGIFFIYKVSKELCEACDPFSFSCTKNLLKSYKNFINKSANSAKIIRDMKFELVDAIKNLQIAAGDIFWTEDDLEKKGAQLFALQAAQHGKSFVQKEDFNFDTFLEICKNIRIVNNLRNSIKPRFITYKEYIKMDPKDLIKKTMRELNFGMAFEISHYLDYHEKKIYLKYATSCMKKQENEHDDVQEKKLLEFLENKLKKISDFSYIKLAKKAFKYHKEKIGLKFLENEKSILTKIPQYIEIKKWGEAIDLAITTNDSYVINTVLDKLLKAGTIEEFINEVKKHPKAKTYIIEFLRRKSPEHIVIFLKSQTNTEEMFFFYVEKYFASNSLQERKECIISCRECLKLIDTNGNFDHKFYKSYIDSLENNLNFKKDCLNQDKVIITKPDETPFDISIFDCYKLCVKAERYNWMEKQNKYFGLSLEGVNMARIIAYGELKKLVAVDSLTKKIPLKKLGLNDLNLAEIYFLFKDYNLAADHIKLVTDSTYFEYKLEMLKYGEKYEEALEVIIMEKNIENMMDFINDILERKPNLRKRLDALCAKYKVTLK